MQYLRFLLPQLSFALLLAATDPSGCGSSTVIPYITVAQVEQRLMSRQWPAPPPGARIEGFAVFEIEVSSKGFVVCMNRVGGHPFLLSALEPTVRAWKFRPGDVFRGLIPVRYSSAGYQLL